MVFIRLILLSLTVSLLSGCSGIAYYSQAISGHLKLMNGRESVQELLESNATDAELKKQLQLASQIRTFATEELMLPDNDSYKSYVATNRKFVTWNVIAAEEFSVKAKTWCFPVAGCVNYKGFFSESDATKLATKLSEQEHLDTTVTGATAYSTLGWFDDPILDIMLRGNEIRLAGLIFHELAHQKLYVKGDSDFNEAYASFVEQEGVRAWLRHSGKEIQLGHYADLIQRRNGFSELLLSARQELEILYEQPLEDEVKREGKQRIISELRQDYQSLKESWNGYKGYDRWFETEINNARLVATATCRRLVPAFEQLYLQVGSDFNAFYKKAEELGTMEMSARQEELGKLIPDLTSLTVLNEKGRS